MTTTYRIGTKRTPWILGLVLILSSFSTGCAAFRDYAGDFAKEQGLKILAKQMDKMEAEFEEKLRAKGLEVEKIKSSADDLTRALTAEHKNPKEAVDAIRKAVDSTKDQNGQHEWYGILALFAYVVKQMWWERRDEHKIKKVVAETNGGGSSSA